jgi:uncharacterized protein (DUF58 family)
MIRLTARGKLFAAIGAFLYLASATSQSALLLMPIGILLGCYLLSWRAAREMIRNLRVDAPRQVTMAEGDRPLQPWTVFNPSGREVRMVKVESSCGGVLLIPSVPANSSSAVIPGGLPARRGCYALASGMISTSAPFGLVQARCPLPLHGEVVVYPKLYPAPAPGSAGFEAIVGGKLKGNRRTNSGHEFSGIRPHHQGDPLKHIHWRSSGKGQGLMVKTFEEELAGRVAILSDGGSSGDPDHLDDCLRAAGSLIFAALDGGDHVEWVNLADARLLVIPPFADGFEVLERLARTPLDRDSLSAPRLRKAVTLVSSRSAYALVLTRMPAGVAEVIAELIHANRKVSVYLPATHPLPPEPRGVRWFHYTQKDLAAA